jgi:1-deoxy-D-xylulose-5-phosphate reductoisomerase
MFDFMTQRALILGSTGSIGQSALSVIDSLRAEWSVAGLAAGSRGADLAMQANRYRPEAIAIADAERVADVEAALDYSPRLFSGAKALTQLVEVLSTDCVLSAVVGASGLAATLRAVELGRRVALANKEALVVAGSLLMPLALESGATLIPVDSEHSAIFQALQAGRRQDVRTVYLTASGGPFRTWDAARLEDVTLEQAMRHPTWNMGPKITVDSATMMNKALEIVEARWLFDLEPDQIKVVVHPESIVHSLVEFCDGSMVAQLGSPDMRTPIQYALTFPRRLECPSPPLDLLRTGTLTFESPDPERFPALRLGYEVAERGGTCGAVLNAANETAVELFRGGAIGFCDIARYAEQALHAHDFQPSPTLDDLMKADLWARQEVNRCMTC